MDFKVLPLFLSVLILYTMICHCFLRTFVFLLFVVHWWVLPASCFWILIKLLSKNAESDNCSFTCDLLNLLPCNFFNLWKISPFYFLYFIDTIHCCYILFPEHVLDCDCWHLFSSQRRTTLKISFNMSNPMAHDELCVRKLLCVYFKNKKN